MAELTKEDQARIITELCDTLKKSMLEKLPQVPANWDGHEIRAWAVHSVETFYSVPLERKRLREFKNDIAIHNL